MHIVIIGNGIAGITAARHIRKNSDHRILVISDEGAEFFSRTALMYVYMGHMRLQDTRPYETDFWAKNKIDLLQARVASIDTSAHELYLNDGKKIGYDRLVLATGSRSNKFGWPGQDLDGVHGLYHLSDLEAMQRHSVGLRRAVVVGGGLIGIEMAEMFHSKHIPVTFLVREQAFWDLVLPPEEADMVGRHITEHGIDLRLGTELSAISDDGSGRCNGVVTNQGDAIACGFVGLTVGVSPNIAFLKGSNIEVGRGILVNEFLETSASDVYAIGDCAELRQPMLGRRPIEAVWYTGRMMGETVAQTICENKQAYQPQLWFNSAKFLDIEYQVYGHVPPVIPAHLDTFIWLGPDGKKSIRLVWERQTGAVVGFNLMGIRYRHEVCERWILTKTPITEVVENLSLANFDPEFYRQYEPDFLNGFNQKTGLRLSTKQLRNSTLVGRFLRAVTNR